MLFCVCVSMCVLTDSKGRGTSINGCSDGSDVSHSSLEILLVPTGYLDESRDLCPKTSSSVLAV